MSDSPIHACPPDGEMFTPCCGKTPFELPGDHRMTAMAELVTCPPKPAYEPDEADRQWAREQMDILEGRRR